VNRGGAAGGDSDGSGPFAARTWVVRSASGASGGAGATLAASLVSAPAWATPAPAGVGLSIMLEASLDPVAARAATST